MKDKSPAIQGLLKKLNKPEMLLLNHLKTQLNKYYPSKNEKRNMLEEELGLNQKSPYNVN